MKTINALKTLLAPSWAYLELSWFGVDLGPQLSKFHLTSNSLVNTQVLNEKKVETAL